MKKTVKVKIAVAVGHDGSWCAGGGSAPCEGGDEFRCLLDWVPDDERRYYVTAELELPDAHETVTVEGEVSDA